MDLATLSSICTRGAKSHLIRGDGAGLGAALAYTNGKRSGSWLMRSFPMPI